MFDLNEMKVLVVTSDSETEQKLSIALRLQGCVVNAAQNRQMTLEKSKEEINLIILDDEISGISPLKMCETIRSNSTVPILLLLTRDEDERRKLDSYTAGGDDWVEKPFATADLLIRIKALLRRRYVYDQAPAQKWRNQWIVGKDIRINSSYNQVFKGDKEIYLTNTEYRLLLLLMSHPKKIFSVHNLYESVWEETYRPEFSSTVIVHIRNLRKKIEDDRKHPAIILTIRGKGYRCQDAQIV